MKRRFIEALSNSGNITTAAETSGLKRRLAEQLRKTDSDFAVAYAEAIDIAFDRLEAEAWRRAVDGIEEYIVRGGKIVLGPDEQPLTIRRKSDPILLILLRAHRKKFRPGAKDEAVRPIDTTAARERLKQMLRNGKDR